MAGLYCEEDRLGLYMSPRLIICSQNHDSHYVQDLDAVIDVQNVTQ